MSLFTLTALAALFQPRPPPLVLASVLTFLPSLLSDPCVQVSVPPQVPGAYKTNLNQALLSSVHTRPQPPLTTESPDSVHACSLGFSSAFHLYHVLSLAST